MRANITMTCSDIKQKLKPFLEDLLAEEEYQAFLAHLDSCTKCKEYVSAVGSLSSQLWKLGDVKVPSDFSSTVLFKLKQAEQEIRAPKFVISKKLLVGTLTFIIAAATLFFGINYLKHRRLSKEVDETPRVEVYIERKPAISDREAKSLLGKLEEIDAMLRVSEKEAVIEEDSEKKTPTSEKPLVVSKVSDKEEEIIISKPRPLHWHFLYSEKSEKEKLLKALNALGIRLDYQAYDLLLFTATGEKLEHVLEQILLTSQGASSLLRDFTSTVPTFPDKEYRVSIYLEKKEASALHWHISFALPHQKPQLLDIIQKRGGPIDYESEELIIFSIPGAEVEKLRARILAMRVGLSEFGQLELKEDLLVSGPVTISIYFSKR